MRTQSDQSGEAPARRTWWTLPPPREWTGEDAELIDWYRRHRDRLPREPFELHPWAKVIGPEGFYRSLDADVAAGSDGPRARWGGLQADLRRLRELFGEASPPPAERTLFS